MKCLVTGAAGFIGSHLCERLLNAGHQVVGIDSLISCGDTRNIDHLVDTRKGLGFSFFCKEVKALEYTFYSNIDWFFHLAALSDIVPSINAPMNYHNANVTGTIAALESARRSNAKKFIYAASSSCYGLPTSYPTDEHEKCLPEYPYALTKYLGEQYVMHYNKVYGLPATSLRLFNVYGPRSRTSGAYGAVFGTFLAQKLHGQPYTVVGDGKQERDFTFVTDVVDAFVRAAEMNWPGYIFNVGSGKTHSIKDLILLLGSENGVEYLPKRPAEPHTTFADTRKIEKALGWKPKVSFEDGVKIMLDNIEDYRNAPLWNKKSIEKATEDWFKFLK